MSETTLWSPLFLVDKSERKILLALYKRGELRGEYTGFLTRLSRGEATERAAVRAAQEQATVMIENGELRAVFTFTGDSYGAVDEYLNITRIPTAVT